MAGHFKSLAVKAELDDGTHVEFAVSEGNDPRIVALAGDRRQAEAAVWAFAESLDHDGLLGGDGE